MRGDGRARRGRARSRSAPPPSPSTPSRSARRSPITTSPRSSTCCPHPPGDAGRWIHYGLTSSDVLDTALALQIKAAGEIVLRGRARARHRARAPRARAQGHALRRPHARHPGRADDVRHQARRLRVRGAPQRRAAAARVRPGERRARSPARSAPTPSTSPDFERRVLDRLGLRRRGRLDPGGPARPPRRAAPGDRARRRRPRAFRHRDPPPAAHRGARGRGAVPRRQAEGLVGDAAQAQPDHHRADHRHRAAAARLLAGGRSRTSPSGTSGTSRTRGAERVALPDATILIDYAQSLAIRVADGMVVHEDRMLENLEITHGALVLAARAAGAGRAPASRATTPTGSSRRTRSAPGTRARRSASCCRRRCPPASRSTSTRSSTRPRSCATRTRSSAGSTRSRPSRT